jgi:hypothetical protein
MTVDRVREHTSDRSNAEIDRRTAIRVLRYEDRSDEEIEARLDALDREWDIERVLETNASALALTGLALGITKNQKWLLLPAVVLPFLLLHALQGWCPPLPLLRRLGIRTRGEIDQEKYALKALRGDFKETSDTQAAASALPAVS